MKKTLDFVSQHDVFVSYSRKDGGRYASGLVDSLTSIGFSCLVDQYGTDAGAFMSARFLRRVAHCRMLVLVGSDQATRSSPVAQELEAFAEAQGTHRIAPIGFTGVAWEGAVWYRSIEGLDRRCESIDALSTGLVSSDVITWLERRFGYAKSKDRLRAYRNAALGAFGLLVAMTLFASWYASRAFRAANEAGDRVRAARAEAERQEAIADSRNLANRASLLVDDGPHALRDALEVSLAAVERAAAKGLRTLESDVVLRRSLSVLPRLLDSRIIPGAPRDLALSPNGDTVAALDHDGVVHVFRSRRDEAVAMVKMPRLSGARLVALSNDAGVLAVASDEKLLVFDVARQKVNRFDAAIASDLEYVDALALAPSGRYLAFVVSSHVSDHTPKLGRVSLIDIQERRPIARLAGELDMSINALAFDSTGAVLAAGGAGREDWTSGLVAIWDVGMPGCDEVENRAEQADVAAANGGRNWSIGPLPQPLLARVKGNVTALAVSALPWRLAVADENEVALWRRSPGGGFDPVRYLPLRFEAHQLVIRDEASNLALIEMQTKPLEVGGESEVDDERAWSYSEWDLTADPTRICLAVDAGPCAGYYMGESTPSEPGHGSERVPVGMPEVRLAKPTDAGGPSADWRDTLSADGARAARVVEGRLEVRDMMRKQVVASFPLANPDEAEEMTFSPSGRYLAVSQGRSLSIFSVAEERVVSRIDHVGCPDFTCTSSVAFSWDETLVAMAGENRAAMVLDLASGKTSRIPHALEVQALAFSRDSSLLATASHEQAYDAEIVHLGNGSEVRLIDARQGKDVARVRLDRFVTGLDFSADDRYLLVTSAGAFVAGSYEIGCQVHAMATRAEDLLAIARSRTTALSSLLAAKPDAELQPWK